MLDASIYKNHDLHIYMCVYIIWVYPNLILRTFNLYAYMYACTYMFKKFYVDGTLSLVFCSFSCFT